MVAYKGGRKENFDCIIVSFLVTAALYFLNSMVQQILEHVITAVPASGLQVLPMATVLAQNLVKSSCSSVHEAKESGLTAIEFLSKLCSIIASEVPGAQKDLDVLSWKELSLIPVTEEIFRPSKDTDTPEDLQYSCSIPLSYFIQIPNTLFK